MEFHSWFIHTASMVVLVPTLLSLTIRLETAGEGKFYLLGLYKFVEPLCSDESKCFHSK